MSLQRRLLLYLLICAPLVWAAALTLSVQRARLEVNELFDSQLIRLAQQVHATLAHRVTAPLADDTAEVAAEGRAADDARDLAVAVWNEDGQVALSDREGADLPYRAGASGFDDLPIAGEDWRVYYLQSPDHRWLVAAGQRVYEREELVYGLTINQVLPWLLVLPLLLAVMAWAVRRALAPMRDLAASLKLRQAHDLRPIPTAGAPAELRPLLEEMNGLFTRIEDLLVRERRFMADAAHELRTPLAALRAQWDVVRGSATPAERALAETKLADGLDRMARLVTQMLSLSRAESGTLTTSQDEIDWPTIVEQAMSDCLGLAARGHIELACEWPSDGTYPMPLLGDRHLITVLLRNLLDNAVRYAPHGTTVDLRFRADRLEIENEGEPLSGAQLARLGERFYRPEGQAESGSGLGISIVRRIAQLHRLELELGPRADGRGVRAVLRFSAA